MIKPPIPHDETRRLQTLRELDILHTGPEERFDRVIRLARNVFQVPVALLGFIDDKRQWLKSRVGLELTEIARDDSFCGHTIAGREVFVVEDAINDERFSDNPLVLGTSAVRFYAGYPLHAPNGCRVGTLAIIDRQARSFPPADAETLSGLGELIEAELFTVTLATTDELTGLSNRRGFLSLAEQGLALCQRNGIPATLALIELAYPGRAGDDPGEDESDRALVDFARCFMNSCRESDIVARVSAVGFCGLFSGSRMDDLQAALERLEAQIASVNETRDPAFPLQFTIGAATWEPDSGLDLEALLRAADESMLQHKRQRARRTVP